VAGIIKRARITIISRNFRILEVLEEEDAIIAEMMINVAFCS
jgi:hypothetical protein